MQVLDRRPLVPGPKCVLRQRSPDSTSQTSLRVPGEDGVPFSPERWRQAAILLMSNQDAGNIRTIMCPGAVGIHRGDTHRGGRGLTGAQTHVFRTGFHRLDACPALWARTHGWYSQARLLTEEVYGAENARLGRSRSTPKAFAG